MKLFSRFLVEAESSKVSDQAKKLNLKSDGHGGWYDSRGEFVAKTEGGKLKFYNQRQRAGQDPPQNRGGQQAQGGQARGGAAAPEPWEKPEDDYNCIITNPAFTEKNKLFRRLKFLGKPFVVLLHANSTAAKFNLSDALDNLKIPILVMTGDHDPNLQSSKDISERLPSANLKILEGVGHGSVLQRPDLTVDNFVEFHTSLGYP